MGKSDANKLLDVCGERQVLVLRSNSVEESRVIRLTSVAVAAHDYLLVIQTIIIIIDTVRQQYTTTTTITLTLQLVTIIVWIIIIRRKFRWFFG